MSQYWTSNLTVYTDHKSAVGHALRMLIAEKDCPCQVEIIRGSLPHPLTEINHQAVLPFLVDKMLALKDIDTIIKYLEERFPCSELMPADPKIRAQIREMSTELRSHYDLSDDKTLFAVNTLAEILTYWQPGWWLLGEEFTLVDIFAAPLLHRAGATSHSQKLRQYMDQLFARPSFVASLATEPG